MIKKSLTIGILSALVATFAVSNVAKAHELWLEVIQDSNNKPFILDLGYGHYPFYEEIPAARLHFFDKVKLHSKTGDQSLIQTKEHNYRYTSANNLTTGVYVATAEYKPQYWTKDTAGKWHNKPKTEVANPATCGIYTMEAKTLFSVGGATDSQVSQKLYGQTLEIVPLFDVNELDSGKASQLQVLLDGKPLAGIEVYGFLKGYGDIKLDVKAHEQLPHAYHSETDKHGRVKFSPIKDGNWMLYVKHEGLPNNKNPHQCETVNYFSTFTISNEKK